MWNYGDELFPVGTFRTTEKWYVYYIGKGTAGLWKLGLASGPRYNVLNASEPVILQSTIVDVIGGGDPASMRAGKFTLLIMKSFSDHTVYAHGVSTSSPAVLYSGSSYAFGDNYNHLTTLYDAATGTWFLYYQTLADPNVVRVKTATIVTDEMVPPPAP